LFLPSEEAKRIDVGNFIVLKSTLLLTAILCFVELPSDLRAQEAVSTTTGPGSAAPSSEPAQSSTSSTTTTGVTSSSGGGPAVEAAPSGIGIFSRSPVQIQANISAGYDDNVSNVSGQKQSSGYTNGSLILDYTFGDPRLQLTLNGLAGGTYYYEHLSGQDYDIDFKGALDITYHASPRLTLGSTLLAEYLTEPSFQYAGGLNTRNGNYLYTSDKAFVSYAWTRRFSTKTFYTFEAFQFDNSTVGALSNRVSNTFGSEFRLQLVPTTTLVAEYRYGLVNYQHDGEIVGITLVFFPVFRIIPVRLQLDSTTHYALAGIDHTFNPRLNVSLRAGAELREYEANENRTAPYIEGTVNYVAGKRTTLSWNTRYGLEEPDFLTAQSRTTLRTGVQTRFQIAPRIASTIDLYYVHDEYHALTTSPVIGTAFSENTFDGGVSVHYQITPLFGVQAGYHYSDVSSGMASREYSRNRFFGGATIVF